MFFFITPFLQILSISLAIIVAVKAFSRSHNEAMNRFVFTLFVHYILLELIDFALIVILIKFPDQYTIVNYKMLLLYGLLTCTLYYFTIPVTIHKALKLKPVMNLPFLLLTLIIVIMTIIDPSPIISTSQLKFSSGFLIGKPLYIMRIIYNIYLITILLKYGKLRLLVPVFTVSLFFDVKNLISHTIWGYREYDLTFENMFITSCVNAIIFSYISIIFLSLYKKHIEKNEVSISDYDDKLSPRESEILKLLLKGCKNREIAEALYISESTVKGHSHRIYKKLKVSSKIELIKKFSTINDSSSSSPPK